MKTKTLTIYADPGHAWVKIPRSELRKYKIDTKISSCSYQRKGYVFLEEDCDAGLYIEALKTRGYVLKYKTFHTNRSSKVRTYENYRADNFCPCCC